MSNEYTFYDYINADGDGTNVIKSWLNGCGKPSKAGFINLIGGLESSPLRGKQESLWKYPHMKSMKKDWKGFIELRKEVMRVQYRIIGQKRGRDVLLVACAIHKDQHYDSTVPSRTALNRIGQMISHPARYRSEHEND